MKPAASAGTRCANRTGTSPRHRAALRCSHFCVYRVDLAVGALRLVVMHDVSLNRRLYAWFFPSGAGEAVAARKVRSAMTAAR